MGTTRTTTDRTRLLTRALLAWLYAMAAALGLGAGFSFGWQAGGGYVLACAAGLCFGVFCTLMVDALVDRVQGRRGR